MDFLFILPSTVMSAIAVTSWPVLVVIAFWTAQTSLSSCLVQILYQPSPGAWACAKPAVRHMNVAATRPIAAGLKAFVILEVIGTLSPELTVPTLSVF
jgi:hypothetical protein